jgi:small subunit ribosomal protein S7
VFTHAVNNVKPMVEVKSRRVGGANYQVPVRSSAGAAHCFGNLRWIRDAARGRGEKSMGARLAGEIAEAAGRSRRRDQEA